MLPREQQGLKIASKYRSTIRFSKCLLVYPPSKQPRLVFFISCLTCDSADVGKCDVTFATWFLLGAWGGLSSLCTQRTWRRIPMNIASEANLLNLYQYFSRTLRGNDRHTMSRPCCHTRKGGGVHDVLRCYPLVCRPPEHETRPASAAVSPSHWT